MIERMASSEMLDQIARLGLFGKRYKDFASAPPEAQKVIRVLADTSAALPLADTETSPRPDRGARALRMEARLGKIEASIARLEKGVAKMNEGLERLEQLDIIRSAERLKLDRSMKIRAGQTRAARMGKQIGRPLREFNRDEAVRLHAGGYSLRRISRVLDVPLSTVAAALRPVVPKVVVQ